MNITHCVVSTWQLSFQVPPVTVLSRSSDSGENSETAGGVAAKQQRSNGRLQRQMIEL